jgi:hypothetical protein
MHKLLRQVFGVLKSQTAFDPNFLSPTTWLSRQYLVSTFRIKQSSCFEYSYDFNIQIPYMIISWSTEQTLRT